METEVYVLPESTLIFKQTIDSVLEGETKSIAQLEEILITKDESIKNAMFGAIKAYEQTINHILSGFSFASTEAFRESRNRKFKELQQSQNFFFECRKIGCALWLKGLLLENEKNKNLAGLCNQAADRLNFAPAIIKTNLTLLNSAEDFPINRLVAAIQNGSHLGIEVFKKKLFKVQGSDLAMCYAAAHILNLSEEIKNLVDTRLEEFRKLKAAITDKLFMDKSITRDEIEILYYWTLWRETGGNKDFLSLVPWELHLLVESYPAAFREIITADLLASLEQKEFFLRLLPGSIEVAHNTVIPKETNRSSFELEPAKTRNLLAVLKWMETKKDPFLELSKQALSGNLQSVRELELELAAIKDQENKKQKMEKLRPILEKLIWHTVKELHQSISKLISLKEDPGYENQLLVLKSALWLQGILFQLQNNEALAKECFSHATTLNFGPALTTLYIKPEIIFTELLKDDLLSRAIQNGSGIAIEIALNKLSSSDLKDKLTVKDRDSYAKLCDTLVHNLNKPLHELIGAVGHMSVMASCCEILNEKNSMLPETIQNLREVINGFTDLYSTKLKEKKTLSEIEIKTLYYAAVAYSKLDKADKGYGMLLTTFSKLFSRKLPKQMEALVDSPCRNTLKNILTQDKLAGNDLILLWQHEIDEIEKKLKIDSNFSH